MQANDLILSVDGTSMKGVKQDEFLKSLRGREGTKVVVEVQQPDSDDVRSFTITRAVVPRVVIEGWAEKAPPDWDYLITHDMGYVKLLEIGSSTVHELKQIARGLQEVKEDIGSDLVIDLRHVKNASLTHTVMLADALRSQGELGTAATRYGQKTYEADEDCLFPDALIYVLVDGSVSGLSEWLVASLWLDNRVQVVGQQMAGHPYVVTDVILSDGRTVPMETTWLKTGDQNHRFHDHMASQDGVPRGVARALEKKRPNPKRDNGIR